MRLEITLKNYRCFSDSKPAQFTLRDGFTGLLGVNNAGKSSLLKFFYEFRTLFQTMSEPGNILPALQGNHRAFQFPGTILDHEELFCNANSRDLSIKLRLAQDGSPKMNGLPIPLEVVFIVPRASNTAKAELHLANTQLDLSRKDIDFQGTILRVGGHAEVEFLPLFDKLKELADTLYIGPFRNAINVGGQGSYFDIAVGQDFIRTWRNYKTGNAKRHNEASYRLTEDIRRIFEFDALEINSSQDEQTLQFFVNGRSYKLSELGAGLAQFVIVLANAATRRPCYILIDEPELNLHPTLQVDFLTTLASYARKGVLFATHSYGLARANAQSVYTVRKDTKHQSEVRPLEATPRLAELLGELSFCGYKELGFDKILLVEGVTDVLTIQQFLRIYGKDHRIVLLPLGGSHLINGSREQELREVTRITSNVFALIDSERGAPNAPPEQTRTAFVQACCNAGLRKCHVLDRRATENYLADAAVKAVKGSNYRAPAPFEELKKLSPSWSKDENWRIAREMTAQDLDNTDLGQFLISL
jgi:ABC-type cobalamin/Fe3+-siderophores transport system ATPase subunit